MAELIHQCEHPVQAGDERVYVARLTQHARGHLWAGWLEFTPHDGGAPLRTGTETTQPNRAALAYWASGLEPIFLEGALGRASRS